MTSTFPKQSLYHSDLREASPLTVRFRTGVEKSQYRGRGHFVGLSIAGDDTDYTYTVENEQIKELLEDVLAQDNDANTWYVLTALGKAEAAYLQLAVPNNGDPPRESARELRPAPLSELGKRTSPERVAIAAELWECLDAAREVVAYFNRQFNRDPSEAELRLASELYRQQQREEATRPVRRKGRESRA